MSHRILTCRNHPDLRWSCKDQAWGKGENDLNPYAGYNGSRHIFFNGRPRKVNDEVVWYSDRSGIYCDWFDHEKREVVRECECPVSDLMLAPEDAGVKRDAVITAIDSIDRRGVRERLAAHLRKIEKGEVTDGE